MSWQDEYCSYSALYGSMELYSSRVEEMRAQFGAYSKINASAGFARYLQGVNTDHLLELTYESRRRIHNLKYYTWVEQQGRTYEEIQNQWYDPNYWTEIQNQVEEIDHLIMEFNNQVGLL